jgi:YidC/Oxa1 family membrane protein insertase
MNDRTRTVIAFALIIGIIILWGVLSKPGKNPEPVKADTIDTAALSEPDTITRTTVPLPMPVSADTVVIERPGYRLVLSSGGGSVKAFYLKDHGINIVPDNEYLFVSRLEDNTVPVFSTINEGDSVMFIYRDQDSEYTKIYYFDNPHGFRLKTDMDGMDKQLLSLKAGLRITEEKNRGEDLRHFNVFLKNEKVEQLKKKIKDEYKYTGNIEWLSMRTKYFALVINNLGIIESIEFYKLPKESSQTAYDPQIDNSDVDAAVFGCFYMRGGGDRFGAEITGPGTMDIEVLLLPVRYDDLKTFKKGYEQMASGGIMGPIARIILWVFNLLYALFRNYGFAIMGFAILIKLVFFPLSRKMVQSQHKMQMIQPELKKIQKKYKDEPQRLNQEMMQLYKTYKVNPFSGCLPLLIQMPIFFALYQTLITSIEFRQAPFIFWITDLSLKDPYYILPIAMGIIMLVQSLLTTLDPRQRFMVIIMPVVMVFIFLNFPSGLQLYWFTYNILTLAEHIIIKRGGMK